MPEAKFRPTPVLLGAALTSLCFVATGGEVLLGLVLAGLVVPTLLRTYLVLVRRRDAGAPLGWMSWPGAFLTSAGMAILSTLWLLVVAALTSSLKRLGLAVVPLLALLGLTIGYIVSVVDQRTADEAERETFRPAWRRLLRLRITVRGMLVVVALIALALWPAHLWRMRATYTAVAIHENALALFCEIESQFMAGRAEQCRQRASQGTAWDLDDEESQALKLCPFPDEGPGHSWREQAEIWEHAAERSRWAARHHRWTSAWHEPWIGPSRVP